MKKIFHFALAMIFFLQYPLLGQTNFDTPYFWLGNARESLKKSDTSEVIKSLEKAIEAGLFYEEAITNSRSFHFVSERPEWPRLQKGILENQSRLQKPEALILETKDIQRFWDVFPSLDDEQAEDLFYKNYILKGSKGLQTFYQIRMNEDIPLFLQRIRERAPYYKSIQPISLAFESMKPEFVEAAQKLDSIYPEAIFPPIYLLMGSLNNVGTADGFAGMLIGVEHLSVGSESEIRLLSGIDREIVFKVEQTVPIIFHEYIHFQQKNKPEKTLLEYSIMEGAADFLTWLILGKHTNPEVFEFGNGHEEKLWSEFSASMYGENTDDWLFNLRDPNTGYPGNMGYYVGFRICESYYQKASDKQQAIQDILEIKDFEEFLRESSYAEKFQKSIHSTLN
ncbi:DUF2268 domain-containing putative Zn-dependent protease [Algoriphagus sp. CAU 1675]|uniref:gliding motility protein GldB-related protein n=1 Tax=Algoriphagus sp. CAU 1675 TaxID=3032597 RepID=UPI0023DB6261|nr:DUF2268 domain-containing putative Zn-dependent protease [Algoriphagus sp. CAU 1675]MDF2158494.1 DUF2268 domain-containing putative Zn-dependent protease [Algoriphagus sp. CAU 1675]